MFLVTEWVDGQDAGDKCDDKNEKECQGRAYGFMADEVT